MSMYKVKNPACKVVSNAVLDFKGGNYPSPLLEDLVVKEKYFKQIRAPQHFISHLICITN